VVGGAPHYLHGRYKSLYVYDPLTDSWEQKADMQYARAELSAVTFDNKIWALGGFTEEVEGVKIVEVYDPATDTWRRAKDLASGHNAGAACVFNGSIYYSGGWIGENINEAYDQQLNIWRRIRSLQQQRCYHAICAVGDKIYALGGLRRGPEPNYVLTIEEFSQFPTGVAEKPKKADVREFTLRDNYPNPFNPSTTIAYDLPKSGYVKLVIYNALGQRIDELVSGYQMAGSFSVIFDAKDLPTGVYFYQLQIDKKFVETKKMVYLK
jgi:N-acetylneuraminic acid mutarotase